MKIVTREKYSAVQWRGSKGLGEGSAKIAIVQLAGSPPTMVCPSPPLCLHLLFIRTFLLLHLANTIKIDRGSMRFVKIPTLMKVE